MAQAHAARAVAFRPRARLLELLGDQLIRDPGIAVFELVKNAYDADASKVTVAMLDIEDPEHSRIVITDDGTGMSVDTVERVWLEPGTDYRANQRARGIRTSRYRRLPLGEKGIGRFAVHKLGRSITLVTRARGRNEVIVEIDWDAFEKTKYLKDAHVEITERVPEVFEGDETGTKIEVRRLRHQWSRGMVRSVARAITSITSPFKTNDTFKPRLRLSPNPGWLEGLLTSEQVLDFALFHVKASIDGQVLSYEYNFRPYAQMTRVEKRRARKAMKLPPVRRGEPAPDLAPFAIGAVGLELYIFDLEPATLSLGVSDKRGLREFLSQNGGVRVYRDGIRVYDYGEIGNDWLELGGRRVNQPTRRLSNNIVLGVVSLDLAASTDLVEKTNREGFVEDEAFDAFRSAVQSAVDQITVERNLDKQRIRLAYSTQAERRHIVLVDAVSDLRDQLRQKGQDELIPYLDRIERDYVDMRDRLLTAAGAGLGLAMVIHEAEKGIRELQRVVRGDGSQEQIRELTLHLAELIDGLTYLTRRSGETTEKASVLVRNAVFNTSYRLRAHNVTLINGFNDENDFTVRCTRRLLVSSLMNLIDNSLYWLEVRNPARRLIYVGPSRDLKGGPAIVVADNGPGFQDPPDFLTEAFVSRKPDGMGLGLHLASEVMAGQGGRVAFPEDGDVELPPGLDGAIVALVFGGT